MSQQFQEERTFAMPYPESCPECGGPFRNTGTHFTARRNEMGRHVLLELGCQNTTRRFWWDFTTGALTEEGRPRPARRGSLASVTPTAAHLSRNGAHHPETNGHAALSTLDPALSLDGDGDGDEPESAAILDMHLPASPASPAPQIDSAPHVDDLPPQAEQPESEGPVERMNLLEALELQPDLDAALEIPSATEARPLELPGLIPDASPPLIPDASPSLMPGASPSLREAFVRQLQLDRLTLRQMRSWLMSEDARRAIEVASGATEATYERLALILFGLELAQLSGRPAAAPTTSGMSAEQRLELQREKARIRARLRRAAAKTNK